MDRTRDPVAGPDTRPSGDAGHNPDTPPSEGRHGFVIDEDWAATIVGLGLLLLALLGVIDRGMVP